MVESSLSPDGLLGPRSEHGAQTGSPNSWPNRWAQCIRGARDRSIHRGAPAVVPVMASVVDVSSLTLGGAAVFNAQGGFTLVFEFKGLLCPQLQALGGLRVHLLRHRG